MRCCQLLTLVQVLICAGAVVEHKLYSRPTLIVPYESEDELHSWQARLTLYWWNIRIQYQQVDKQTQPTLQWRDTIHTYPGGNSDINNWIKQRLAD